MILFALHIQTICENTEHEMFTCADLCCDRKQNAAWPGFSCFAIGWRVSHDMSQPIAKQENPGRAAFCFLLQHRSAQRCCSNLSCTEIPGKENNHFRSQPTRSVTTGCPGIRAPSLCVSLCLGVTSAPQSPGFSSLSHWLSSHYYSGHQQPGNPTLLTSGAHAVIREIFKHSYY